MWEWKIIICPLQRAIKRILFLYRMFVNRLIFYVKLKRFFNKIISRTSILRKHTHIHERFKKIKFIELNHKIEIPKKTLFLK